MWMYIGMLAYRRLGRLAPQPVLRLLGVLFAVFAYLGLPRKRANMRRNLRIVLTGSPRQGTPRQEQRVRRLARHSMYAYVRTLFDFMNLPRMLPHLYADTEATRGWEHLDLLLAEGRGALFVTVHFGHWDLAAAALAHHCPPGTLYAVAEEFAHSRLNELVLQERTNYGIGIVPMDNVRQMIRVLREGKVLGILVDRPVGEDDGVPVTFFGQPTQLPAGAAALAMLARCPILPGYLRQRGDGRFEGVVLPPIEPVRTGDREADLAETMQLVVAAMETIIRRSPHQWYMFRDMWPTAEPRARGSVAWERLARWSRLVRAGGRMLVRPLLSLLASTPLGR